MRTNAHGTARALESSAEAARVPTVVLVLLRHSPARAGRETHVEQIVSVRGWETGNAAIWPP
jgi:hypothetical protein